MWTLRRGTKFYCVSHMSCAGVLLALFTINTLCSLMAADDPKAAAAFPSEDQRKSAVTLFYYGASWLAHGKQHADVNTKIKCGLEWDYWKHKHKCHFFYRYTVQLHVAI